MKIAILGYGKMGKVIDDLATAAGHEIVLTIDAYNQEKMTSVALQEADVAIEFSRPEAAVENIKSCLDAGIPIVCGTTGWLDKIEEIRAHCNKTNGAFFYASNFSIGVNIFFELNKYLAELMNTQQEYEVHMEEIHHTEKLDAPSGTAITLAKGILEKIERKAQWINNMNDVPTDLSIVSKRLTGVPGTHSVSYQSSIDTIEIKHTAHSREGFAKGAIQAASWIIGKHGIFGMEDMLGF